MNKFAKDTLFTFATNVVQLVIVIIISIIIVRSLGPEGKGIPDLWVRRAKRQGQAG